MNKRAFKYENRSKKKIRLRDLLMLLSVFALSIITVVATGNIGKKEEKVSTQTELVQNISEEKTPKSPLEEASLQEYETNITSSDEISYEILPPLDFIKPVEGVIIKPFSPKELIYSDTMDDWRIHTGIDIACPYGSNIVSSERGSVTKVEYNINYGHTVTVDSGEYTIIYSSLSSDVLVSEGQNLSKGDIIGKTSDTCMSEICDEPHLHLEVLKNGEYMDPLDIIEYN